MSTFRTDGYCDAINGLRASPPDPRTRDDGESTNVYAAEYMLGYQEAARRIQSEPLLVALRQCMQRADAAFRTFPNAPVRGDHEAVDNIARAAIAQATGE